MFVKEESDYHKDNGQLNPTGLKKLAKNWELCLRRLKKTYDGRIIMRRIASNDTTMTIADNSAKANRDVEGTKS